MTAAGFDFMFQRKKERGQSKQRGGTRGSKARVQRNERKKKKKEFCVSAHLGIPDNFCWLLCNWSSSGWEQVQTGSSKWRRLAGAAATPSGEKWEHVGKIGAWLQQEETVTLTLASENLSGN